MPDLGWDTIIARTFLLTLVAGVALTGAYLALNPPAVADVALPARARRAGLGVGGSRRARRRALRRLPRRPGHGDVGRPRLPGATTGLTYAEYVHQGFGQLTVATFLTVVVVGLTMRVARRETPRTGLLRALLGALCVLTLAVVASALYRMSLYQDAYGYTVLGVRRRLRAVARPRRRDASRRGVRLSGGGCRARR